GRGVRWVGPRCQPVGQVVRVTVGSKTGYASPRNHLGLGVVVAVVGVCGSIERGAAPGGQKVRRERTKVVVPERLGGIVAAHSDRLQLAGIVIAIRPRDASRRVERRLWLAPGRVCK